MEMLWARKYSRMAVVWWERNMRVASGEGDGLGNVLGKRNERTGGDAEGEFVAEESGGREACDAFGAAGKVRFIRERTRVKQRTG
jgi:hypothetical protein